jgi:uncharacterized membrane protein YdjX (TVP38/TMEM64 family)
MPSKLALAKPVGFIAIVGVAVVLLSCSPLRVILDPQTLSHQLDRFGHWAVLLFLVCHVLAAILSVPGTVLVMAGGALFGMVWGTIWSVIGATLGAIAAFLVARYLLRGWLWRRLRHYKLLRQFRSLSDRHAFSCVLAVRFTPISPFCLVNFLFGLTPIGLKPYAFGTFIGIIPGTIAYTWLGVTGNLALNNGELMPFVLTLMLLAVLSLMPWWMQWLHQWRDRRSQS